MSVTLVQAIPLLVPEDIEVKNLERLQILLDRPMRVRCICRSGRGEGSSRWIRLLNALR